MKMGLYQNNFQISICTKQSSKNKENLPKHSLFCCVLGDFLCNIFSKGYFDTVPFTFGMLPFLSFNARCAAGISVAKMPQNFHMRRIVGYSFFIDTGDKRRHIFRSFGSVPSVFRFRQSFRSPKHKSYRNFLWC